MSDASEAVLGRVRRALRGAERGDLDEVRRDYRFTRPVADPVALFCERVADYRATVERSTTDALPAALAAAAHRAGAARLLIPDGAPQAWFEALRSDFDLAEPEADTASLDEVDAVVTTAAVGIASTGTVVLDHGRGQGRRAATLVPDVHVCVVTERQVVDDAPPRCRGWSRGGR